jgi:endogenous inhibitor of DNA gyrase (YacG/DUF329 family)
MRMGMARIKAECPGCGVVRVEAPQVHVAGGGAPSAYRFECPRCAHPVVRRTSPAICAVLVAVGAREDLDPDSGWLPTASSAVGEDAPLTAADVDAFRLQLEDDAAIAAFLDADPPRT